MEQFDMLLLQYRHIEHMHEGGGEGGGGDQLLPQFLMEQFDMLLLQYRHIEHMHEGVWFGKKIIFDKMTSMRT